MLQRDVFLLRCKKEKKGTVQIRMSNIGKSYCLYSKSMNPIMYIRENQFDKISHLFDFDIQKGVYKLKPETQKNEQTI